MSILSLPRSQSDRVTAGDAVLEAAKSASAAPVAKRLAAFGKAHRAYAAAESKAESLGAKLAAAQVAVAEADVEQDVAVVALAATLPGAGFKRTNPFGDLGFDPPTVVCQLGYAKEAKTVHALVRTLLKRKGLPPNVVAAAKRADAKATAVEAALEKAKVADAAWHAALTARNALAQPWETAFAALKLDARAAAREGAADLFDTLFRATAPAKRARAAKRAKKADAPVAGG
jgi:hypothetical protein